LLQCFSLDRVSLSYSVRMAMTFRWAFSEAKRPGALFKRLQSSTVAWSWVFNAFRLGAGLILLPLVLTKLSIADLGMYYVLLGLAAFAPVLDFGFGPSIARFITYAMAGAEDIQPQGLGTPARSGGPNFALLWNLLYTTRTLYRYLSLVVLVVLGISGTYIVELRVYETSSPALTRLAWAITLAASVWDIYSGWWVTYLRNSNQVLHAVRIGVYALLLRLLIAAGLLIGGAGLLSLPVATFLSSILQRQLARAGCHRLLALHPAPQSVEVRKYFRILWPNTWRLGVQFASSYLTSNANMAICLFVLGLSANARYGLSIQLLTILAGMASAWTAVKWPIIGQLRAQHDYEAVKKILAPRIWLQNATFIAGAVGLVFLARPLLGVVGGGKQILAPVWFVLLALNSFLEMQFAIWGTLISLENRLPHLWPLVATNCLSLVLSLALIHITPLGLGALVLGPLISGSLFHYWYWPGYATRSLGMTLAGFMFTPKPAAKAERVLVAR
jgi:O-antigen/teichoic acid export membrane protein